MFTAPKSEDQPIELCCGWEPIVRPLRRYRGWSQLRLAIEVNNTTKTGNPIYKIEREAKLPLLYRARRDKFEVFALIMALDNETFPLRIPGVDNLLKEVEEISRCQILQQLGFERLCPHCRAQTFLSRVLKFTSK